MLQEYVGPSIFQWPGKQLMIANNILALLPEKDRTNQTRTIKFADARDMTKAVRAVSAFEDLRPGEIVPPRYKKFEVLDSYPSFFDRFAFI